MKYIRIIAAGLCVCLLVSLTACRLSFGKPTQTTEPSGQTQATTSEAVTEVTEAPTVPEDPSPADSIIQLPQPQDIVPLPSVLSVDALVSTVPCEDPQWSDGMGNQVRIPLQIPQFRPFSQGAIDAQAHLNAQLRPMLDDVAVCKQTNTSPGITGIRYESFLWKDILSVLVIGDTSFGDIVEYFTYNFDLATGAWLGSEALLHKLGYAYEYYAPRASTAAAECFYEKYYFFSQDNPDGFAQEQYDNTVARENIDAAQLYLQQDGSLILVIKIYSLAGADAYVELIDLTPYLV